VAVIQLVETGFQPLVFPCANTLENYPLPGVGVTEA